MNCIIPIPVTNILAESLFRNAVGASKPSAAEAAMRDAQIGNTVGVAVAKMSHLQMDAGVNTSDFDMRRPATSGLCS